MATELEVFADAGEVADAAASRLARWTSEVVAARGRCSVAVSGGRTPWAMFAALARLDLPWEQTVFFQVDERIAPAGAPERNLVHLRAAFGDAPAQIVPMPVEAEDLEQAAADYARALPERLDLVHLGIGPDGHTASLVPDDPVLEISDRSVAVTATAYQGQRRMTLTYPALARADQLLWVIAGADKQSALAKLLAGDRSIPAGRLSAARSLVLADRAAASTGE
jgi:6-phosphogluconolactonase